MSDRSTRADDRNELVLSEPLAESSIVHTAPVHIPGMPLETVKDRDNRLKIAAEREKHAPTQVPVPNPTLDTRSPRANLASRDNIVPAGPGSAGDEPALDLPGLAPEDQLVEPSRDGTPVIELRGE